jgi:5-methylcytosine-specific restriction endonuclease McrA
MIDALSACAGRVCRFNYTMIGYTIYKSRGNGGADLRGNSKDRKRRKEWMLTEFGDGTTVVCSFEDCDEILTYDTVTADRYPLSGKEGGRYIRSNIRPACGACNSADGTRIKNLPELEAGPTGLTW